MDEVRSGSSYISQNDLRVHFGLGAAAKIDAGRSPAGRSFGIWSNNIAVDGFHTLTEGSGKALPAAPLKQPTP